MIGTSLHFLQEKLLFLPTELNQDYKFQFEQPFEELFLKPEKNVSLNALHFKAEDAKGVILYFHGNAGDLNRWGAIAGNLVEKQYDVLIMDYRTYGKSKGELSEKAFYDDAQFCYKYLLKQYSEDEIILFGRSLGTGIATFLAAENNPEQLILETPYYNILDVAKHRFPIFPVSKLLKYKFPSNQFIQNVNCPITILHGTEDGVVPYDSAKKLYDVAPRDLTTFITIEGGGHNDLAEYEVYHDAISTILE